MDKEIIRAAWHEAIRRYPASECGLVFFWYASGLGAITPTEEEAAKIIEAMQNGMVALRERLNKDEPKVNEGWAKAAANAANQNRDAFIEALKELPKCDVCGRWHGLDQCHLFNPKKKV